MKRGRIIDAEFVVVDQSDQSDQPVQGQTRKKPTLGQLWYLVCYACLLLGFLIVAVPLLIGALYILFLLLKVVFLN